MPLQRKRGDIQLILWETREYYILTPKTNQIHHTQKCKIILTLPFTRNSNNLFRDNWLEKQYGWLTNQIKQVSFI